MLSPSDLERLIKVKRSEIEKEKTLLGLITQDNTLQNVEDKENMPHNQQKKKPSPVVNNYSRTCDSKYENSKILYEREEQIPADLEKYIRRYVGLPVMLKTGEYSPNNPLLRSERDTRSERDVFIGLGEYEERKKSLRRLRQQEYKEFLDQQAKKKQEERLQYERERQLAEERDRKRIEEYKEKERHRLEEQKRRISVDQNFLTTPDNICVKQAVNSLHHRPLSVACQTESDDFLRINTPNLTQAERELSPKTVLELPKSDPDERPIKPALWHDENHGDYIDEKQCDWQQVACDRSKLYPSIFDADAIHVRNLQSLQEATERKQFYQQELKNQIEEQQRIREERRTREKMLEMAEIRRLEEQLRLLGISTADEREQQHALTLRMKENKEEFQRNTKKLQKDIENDQKLYRNAKTRSTHTSKSDDTCLPKSKLPFYYPPILEKSNEICNKNDKVPFSINIPENSIFSPNYDVDSYLRKNLNPKKLDYFEKYSPNSNNKNIQNSTSVNNYNLDTLPIPVLRHSPKFDENLNTKNVEKPQISEKMKVIDNKWQVPIVQKNILKSLPNNEGKSVNILTQLGSIRRQLQLEQLKLDRMLEKV